MSWKTCGTCDLHKCFLGCMRVMEKRIKNTCLGFWALIILLGIMSNVIKFESLGKLVFSIYTKLVDSTWKFVRVYSIFWAPPHFGANFTDVTMFRWTNLLLNVNKIVSKTWQHDINIEFFHLNTATLVKSTLKWGGGPKNKVD